MGVLSDSSKTLEESRIKMTHCFENIDANGDGLKSQSKPFPKLKPFKGYQKSTLTVRHLGRFDWHNSKSNHKFSINLNQGI